MNGIWEVVKHKKVKKINKLKQPEQLNIRNKFNPISIPSSEEINIHNA